MASEAAAEILSQKLETLLHHPECVRCLSMDDLVKEAKKKVATIQGFFSTQDRPSKSMEWLGRLLRAMYEAEDFIDKFHLGEARGRHGALHVVTRPAAELVSKYELWRNLSNLVKKLEELCQDQYLKSKMKMVPASSCSPASVTWQGQKKVRLTSYWNLQASYLCRKEKKKKIMELIEGEAKGQVVTVTSIWGEEGTGKTLLARSVYGEAMCLGVESRAWVHVSAGMEVKEFLFEILRQMGMPAREVKDMSLDEITEMLSNELAKRKKYLIVLDNVQQSNTLLLLRFVGIILFHRQGHIIIATRHSSIDGIMKLFEATGIVLDKLNDDKSKKMLASKLYRVPDGQNLWKNKDILSTCGGLPLSLSLLGGLLSYAEEHERQEPKLSALLKDCSGLSGIVQSSYRRLPVHLKPCFIYMALFPVASLIPTRRLVRLWLAEGLLDSHCYDSERKRTRLPEDVGENFILELAERNLIDVVSWRADGSPKACQMPTRMHDMILPIAISSGFLHIHDASKSKHGELTSQQEQAQPRETKVRWLAEHTNIVRGGQGSSNPGLNLGQVRSFLSFYLRRGMLTKDIGTVLRNITSKTDYSLLRVLDLEGVYKPSLQGVLHKLVLLRYLGLRSTVLDSIPREVADLHYLETLDIKHTNITSLPSSLWKARNLRHLHLNWFYIDLKKILKACGNNVEALAKLQTLSGLVIGDVKENSMTEHMNSLTSLTTLKLFLQQSDKGPSSGAAGKMISRWISTRLTNLQSLTFGVIQEAKSAEEAETAKGAEPQAGAKQEVGAAPAEPTKAKPKKSQVGGLPTLSLAEHHELLELYLLGQLEKPIWTRLLPDSLRVLTLSGSKVETDMIPELGNLLTSLRTLRLLANSFRGKSLRFTAGGFPSLKILKIWKLPQLEDVTIEEGAMPHLKEVEFRHLEKLKTIDRICRCKELETIWVIYGTDKPAFVKPLEDGKGDETILHVERDTEGSGSMDTDEDDRDKEGETSAQHPEEDGKGDETILHVERDTEGSGSMDTDEDDRDKEGETSAQHPEEDGKGDETILHVERDTEGFGSMDTDEDDRDKEGETSAQHPEEDGKGDETILHVERDTEGSGSMDTDEDDRDKEGETSAQHPEEDGKGDETILHVERDTEGSGSMDTDEDDRDKEGETSAQHPEEDGKGDETIPHVERDTEGFGSMDTDEDDRDKEGETSAQHPEEDGKGDETILHVERDTEGSGSMDTDEDDRDKEGETSAQHPEEEKHQSTGDGNRDEGGDMSGQHTEKERPQSTDDSDDNHIHIHVE
ncbi:putative disease resistance protein At1g58400 [Rhodamnia argentea]|uniref:Disease resistance protein At1g58400 n=1 Tax=Rhodamnia argentea TaxID=178133 RepID=A0ABM3HSS2_9MYRT|nr:putative disease resistance protein At1g58400 [Rhodamnia argentea]